MVKGTLYGPGDYAFVMSDSDDRGDRNWHWKTKISRLFAHSCRGHSKIFFEGKWLYNSTARFRGQEEYRFNPISNMEILNPIERVAIGDSCRPMRLIQCHFFPIHQKKPGDNHILAIPTGPHTKHSTLFQEGSIGHPPPLPEAEDVMLVVHGPTCAMKSIEFCVVMGVHDAPVEGGQPNKTVEIHCQCPNIPFEITCAVQPVLLRLFSAQLFKSTR
ncbi:hypothetical protein R1sor_015423 [Riccia sorocarpa]|uniref:Uncharacterized protein n=1 Tax=Riccia sorocarpa TaxID=122646 RepID=A0ABD3HF77_9MARC